MKKGSGHGAISEFNFQLMLTARMMISSGLARNNHRKAQQQSLDHSRQNVNFGKKGRRPQAIKVRALKL